MMETKSYSVSILEVIQRKDLNMKTHSYRFLALIIVLSLAALSCKLLSPNAIETQTVPEIMTEVPQESVTEAVAESTPETPPNTDIITEAVMATDVQSDTYDPIGVADTFPASQSVFHCVVTIENAPENTTVKSIWSVVNVEGVEKGFVMGETEVNASGSRNIDFSFSPNNGTLPPGDYQVQLLVNGVADRIVSFTVQSE